MAQYIKYIEMFFATTTSEDEYLARTPEACAEEFKTWSKGVADNLWW